MNPAPKEPLDPAFYEFHFPRLVDIATSELHIPEEKAASLVHDLLLAALLRRTSITDMDVWLEGALRSAASRLAEARS